MTTQPEQILENNLVKQLTGLKYAYVHINNEDSILANLKSQLESFNDTTFSEKEFGAILNHLASETTCGLVRKINSTKRFHLLAL